MSTGRGWQVDRVGRFTPKRVSRGCTFHRRGGLDDRRHQGHRRRPGWRHDHERVAPLREAAARLQDGAAARVRRALSGAVGPVRVLPGRAAEAQAERLRAALRTGSVDRARLRIPLRVPRPAAHGHRPGAARARVRACARHERADGGLRSGRQRRRGAAASTIRRACRPVTASCGSRSSPRTSWCRRSTSGGVLGALPGEARRAEEDAAARHADVAAVRAAARGGRARLLRPAEVREPRLCVVRLRVQPFPGGAARRGSTF